MKTSSRQIVIAGTLIIWAIKFIVRPYIFIPYWLTPLTGISPNLIGSFLLPFGACWFFQRYFRLESIQDLKITCLFGLGLVIVNEYLQLIPVFGRTFDYLDILASFIGVGIGYFVFARLMAREALNMPG